MKLCSGENLIHHGELAHESIHCPACVALSEREDFKHALKRKRNQLYDLKQEVHERGIT